MTTLIHNPNQALGLASVLEGDAAIIVEAVATSAVQKGQGVRGAVVSGRLEVATSTASNDALVGVAMESVSAGRVVKVAVAGIVPVQASGTSVAAGTAFSIGASGRVAAVAATLNHKAAGWMLEASGTTAGDLKLAFLSPCLVAVS